MAPQAPEAAQEPQEWRHEDTKAIASANKLLFEKFKADSEFENDMNRIAWLDELRRAKASRDAEIAALRADRRADRSAAQDKKAHDAETAGIVREAQQRHRATIHTITAAKPKPLKFDGWLVTAAQKDATAAQHLAWRQQKNDREADKRASRMFDLRIIMDDAGWHPDSCKGDTETWTHPTDPTRTVVMKLDQGGYGIRWLDPNAKKGGGFDALLSAIYEDSGRIEYLRKVYLSSIPADPSSTLPRCNLLDHRTLDVTDARRLWKQSRPVAPGDLDNGARGRRFSDVLDALKDRADQVRVIHRPGGMALIIADKDAQGNIVGFELVSQHFTTITRGSNVKEAFACKAVEKHFGRMTAEEQSVYEVAKTDARCLDRLPPKTQERMKEAIARIADERDEPNPLELRRKIAAVRYIPQTPAQAPSSSHGRGR